MVETGIFATKEELEGLKTSVSVSGMWLSGGIPFSDPQKECHKLALKHGLPEITGYYGINNEGEFVKEP